MKHKHKSNVTASSNKEDMINYHPPNTETHTHAAKDHLSTQSWHVNKLCVCLTAAKAKHWPRYQWVQCSSALEGPTVWEPQTARALWYMDPTAPPYTGDHWGQRKRNLQNKNKQICATAYLKLTSSKKKGEKINRCSLYQIIIDCGVCREACWSIFIETTNLNWI